MAFLFNRYQGSLSTIIFFVRFFIKKPHEIFLLTNLKTVA